jgi:hypothetical protein
VTAEGLKTALAYGEGLPFFRSLDEAKTALISEKDRLVAELLSHAASAQDDPALDFSVESLLRLEKWYLKRFASSGFIGFLRKRQRRKFARCCAKYFGEVVIRSRNGASWVVEELPFRQRTYTIGVREKLMTMALHSFEKKLHHPDNLNRDSMWRTYQHYFARNPKVTIRF